MFDALKLRQAWAKTNDGPRCFPMRMFNYNCLYDESHTDHPREHVQKEIVYNFIIQDVSLEDL